MQRSAIDNDYAAYIDVNAMSKETEVEAWVGPVTLTALHAFTGCDYTAPFSRKGEVKELNVLEEDKNGSVIKALTKLLSANSDIDLAPFENFVRNLYGFKWKTKTVNEARITKLHQQAGGFDR